MATIIMMQGAEPITLHESESFNKVRKRFVDAQKQRIAFENGAEAEYIGWGDLSFKVEDGGEGTPGRVCINVERVIAVCSTTEKDGAGGE